jgi:hypothetical protein
MAEWEYVITPEQDEVFENCTAKYNLIKKGRRFGLTHGFSFYVIETLLQNGGPILWGDTINGNIDRYFQRYFLPELNKIGKEYWIWNQQKRELRIANNLTTDPTDTKASICDFRSADTPENWEGFGYRLIILNEAGIILKDEYLYKNAILPMLLDYPDSRLIAGGVPKGKTIKSGKEHPFYTLCKKAEEGHKNYKMFTFTSYQSAVASKEDIDELVSDLGGPNSPIVRQEIFGEFVDFADLPFLYAFHENIHVSETELLYNPQLQTVYLCWDFNVKSTCLVIQYYENDIYILREYHERGIDTICNQILLDFPGARIYINGDASGNNENASNETYYEEVKSYLGITYFDFHVPKANPRHKASYRLCNFIFSRLNVQINKSCKGLIRDCNLVQIQQIKGKIQIDKSDETLTHHLDPLRYHLHAEHYEKIQTMGFKAKENED